MTVAPPQAEIEKMAAPAVVQSHAALERLRELRAEIQDLQAVLDDVRTGQARLQNYADYIQTTKDDVEALMTEIHNGDSVDHLHNLWEQLQACPLLQDPAATYEPQDQLHHLDTLDGQIRKMTYLIGLATIPSRLNDWLDKARPGYYIPFHLVFEDEIPSQEDRVRVLTFLSFTPQVIKGGLVDAANGLIYRYHKDARQRWVSALWLVLGFLLCAAIVAGAAFVPVKGWVLTAENLSLLLIGWAALLIGVVVHVAVGSRKRAQTAGGLPPIFAVSDVGLLIDARLGQILMKLLLALVGFFGLVFASGVANVTVLNCFLVGYSLDSVVELFGTSLDQQASAQVESLKKQLSIA